jgi:hypothetical protein
MRGCERLMPSSLLACDWSYWVTCRAWRIHCRSSSTSDTPSGGSFEAFLTVEGTNVRAHVVGTEVYATVISTEATEYRYAHRQGSQVELYTMTLPDALAERCISLAHALDLAFAGTDLKITPDQRVYCFEVNPAQRSATMKRTQASRLRRL